MKHAARMGREGPIRAGLAFGGDFHKQSTLGTLLSSILPLTFMHFLLLFMPESPSSATLGSQW